AILDKKGRVTQNRWLSRDDAIAAQDAFNQFRDENFIL
ncbi:MAG: hypothetical protein XD78_2239, partial [Desulfotomaculum sp. 46_296]